MTDALTLTYSNDQPRRVFLLLMKPPAYPFLGASLLASAAFLWFSQVPFNLGAFFLYVLAALLLSAYWITRFLIRIVLNRIYKTARIPLLSRWQFSAIALVASIFSFTASIQEWPFEIAFAIHRASLEKFADHALADPVPPPPHHQIGPFPMHDITVDRDAHVVRFLIGGAEGFLTAHGLAVYRGPGPGPRAEDLESRFKDGAYEKWHSNWYRLNGGDF